MDGMSFGRKTKQNKTKKKSTLHFMCSPTCSQNLPTFTDCKSTSLWLFQTSLPLAALPLRRLITTCRFMVYSSQRPRRFGLSPSGIAPELNWSQLYVICRGWQSGKVIDLLARRCLVIPLWQVALAQLYKSHHQSGNAASGNLVWKQH